MGRFDGRGASLLKSDEATGKHEQRQVIVCLLGPADENRAVAVKPRVASLNYPAAGPPVRVQGLEVDLLFAGADVRRKFVFGDQVPGLAVVVGPVQTDARVALAVGWGRGMGMEWGVPLSSLWSFRLAPAWSSPTGTPAPSVSVLPLFSSIGGIGASLLSAQRRLGHGSVSRKEVPVDANHLIIFQQPPAPELTEHARSFPLLEAAVGRAA